MAGAWLACARGRLAGYSDLERFERFLFGGGDADGLCMGERARWKRTRNGLAGWVQIARAFGADSGGWRKYGAGTVWTFAAAVCHEQHDDPAERTKTESQDGAVVRTAALLAEEAANQGCDENPYTPCDYYGHVHDDLHPAFRL